MSIYTHTLIWLFPVAFMLHDFEEITFWELWLNKHGDEVKSRVPAFLAKQVGAIVGKSTAQCSLSVCLIFTLTVLSSFLATGYEKFGFFLLASGAFFAHGFMHLGQAIILRRYIPAVITSALIVIPYSIVLYWSLASDGIVDLPGLFIYFLLGAVLMVPFILIMHKVGDYLYTKAAGFLIH